MKEAIIVFDSTEERFKKPYGAVQSGQVLHLRVYAHDLAGIQSMRTVILYDRHQIPAIYEMTRVPCSHGKYTPYEITFPVYDTGLYWYFFEITTEEGTQRIHRDAEGNPTLDETAQGQWQLTVYHREYDMPVWLYGGVFYHVFVDRFCAGYEDALCEGQKIGLDVFFAWEQNFDGDEYLVYGPDKAWLLKHPDVEHWTRKKQLEEIHKAGGAVSQAHPFRHRQYLKYILLGKKYCDGIEVANTGNTPDCDAYARRYAEEYGFLTTAGSDNHNSPKADPARLMGVETDVRLTGPMDYARLIRSRGAIRPVIPAGWFDVDVETAPHLVTYWVDEDNPDMLRIPTNRDFLRE